MATSSAAAAAAPAPFKFGFPVPLLLWDALEETFRANMRRLAKDIAKTLGESETPLLEAIFKGNGATIRPYLYEESHVPPSSDRAGGERLEIDMTCSFLCQRPDAPQYLQCCGQPIVWFDKSPHITRCAEHLYSKPAKSMARLIHLRPLDPCTLEEIGASDGAAACPMLFQSEDGTIYDTTFQVRGRYDFMNKTLMIFTVKDDA